MPDPIMASTTMARPTGTAAARNARNSEGPVLARAIPVRAKMPAPMDWPISIPIRCSSVMERFRFSRGDDWLMAISTSLAPRCPVRAAARYRRRRGLANPHCQTYT
jgi:hypothetical protein